MTIDEMKKKYDLTKTETEILEKSIQGTGYNRHAHLTEKEFYDAADRLNDLGLVSKEEKPYPPKFGGGGVVLYKFCRQNVLY